MFIEEIKRFCDVYRGDTKKIMFIGEIKGNINVKWVEMNIFRDRLQIVFLKLRYNLPNKGE